MTVQEIERTIEMVADSTGKKSPTNYRQRKPVRVRLIGGHREFARPRIRRSRRLNEMVLSRDEVKAFARLEAKSRRLGKQD